MKKERKDNLKLYHKKVAWLYWLKKRADEIRDALGMPIDKEIKEPVIMFNAVGLQTRMSCEGHLDHGLPAPWIDVEAPNRPKFEYKKEREIFRNLARKYKVSMREVRYVLKPEVFDEVMKECERSGETEEYKKWKNENKKLFKKAKKLLDEFYKNRKVDPDSKLKFQIFSDFSFRIHNGGKYYKKAERKGVDNLSERDKKILAKKIEDFRKEMKAFAEFLKHKYFSDNFKLSQIKV